mmetsp:Transcript_120/g.316  ORF Transcript_120/g.316 Transcript_120/m.316 type:complete len:443 (+) Transcript_120:358-1686(+)
MYTVEKNNANGSKQQATAPTMIKPKAFLVALFILVVALSSRAESAASSTNSSTTSGTGTSSSSTEESSSSPAETAAEGAAIPVWPPSTNPHATVRDLHNEYENIFRYGNRNAASHRWSSFLLQRSAQMTLERLELFFSGFCAVSGSPVRPNNYNRYKLTLPRLGGGGAVEGTMHYCCWPCVCDTQDFVRIDTLTVTTRANAAEGGNHRDNRRDDDGSRRANTNTTTTESQQLFFAVIGNPCDHPDRLEEPFYQPFYGGRMTTLSETAREVRCTDDGRLEGATLSDHGYVIVSMFFEARPVAEHNNETGGAVDLELPPPQPGRITTLATTSATADDGPQKNTRVVMVQDEREYGPRCRDRADNGYNSGMGEIFRKVCAVSPIPPEALAATAETESKPPQGLPVVIQSEAEESPSCDAAAAGLAEENCPERPGSGEGTRIAAQS